MKEQRDDPFEKARESKATWGQIVIVNMCMFALGLFNLCTAGLAYNLEFYEEFDRR